MLTIVDVKVLVSPHRTLNAIRGELSEDDFLHIREELFEGHQSSSVVSVKRLKFWKDCEQIPSHHVIPTFDRYILPKTIKVGDLSCHIFPNVPDPHRRF